MRLVNLYQFIRRTSEMGLNLTIPRMAAIEMCARSPTGSGELKQELGCSQAYWTGILQSLHKDGLVQVHSEGLRNRGKMYAISKPGKTALELMTDVLDSLGHDSRRVKNVLSKYQG